MAFGRRRGDDAGAESKGTGSAGTDSTSTGDGIGVFEQGLVEQDETDAGARASVTPAPSTAPADPTPPTKAPRAHRVIWLVAAVAVVSLLAGIVVSRFIVSPAQAAADAAPPTPGLITVPVEERVVSNAVTMRADITYDDAVGVTIDTAAVEGRAIVTGQVPEVGATLQAASVALEVSGRPVIVLPGDLPAYRSLAAGMSGPDVVQLKWALISLGIDGGDPASDVYDSATAAGVAALFSRVGYEAPTAVAGGTDPDAAAEEVANARSSLEQAQVALDQKLSGATESVRVQQDNLVRAAQRNLAEAQLGGNGRAVADAQDALTLALATREEALATPDARSERAAVTAAESAVTRAEEALVAAQDAALTPLPASEVLFLGGLPRRVDDVAVKRGSTVEGTVMNVSGATLTMSGTASSADKDLLAVDMPATFELPDGTQHGAKITAIEAKEASSDEGGDAGNGSSSAPSAGSGGFTVSLAPDPLTPEQIDALKGSNVRISIPVSSTDGAVLAVPLAALTAGPGGESRVEVQKGSETTLVDVTTGLAADGFVEITESVSPIVAGDRVVVGR